MATATRPLHQFEAVDGAYDALIRSGDFMTCDDPRAWIRKSSILFEACVDAGMSIDEPSHFAWAGEFIVASLTAA